MIFQEIREEWKKWYELLVPFLQLHDITVATGSTCYGTVSSWPYLMVDIPHGNPPIILRRPLGFYRVAFQGVRFVVDVGKPLTLDNAVGVPHPLEDPECDAEAVLNKILALINGPA